MQKKIKCDDCITKFTVAKVVKIVTLAVTVSLFGYKQFERLNAIENNQIELTKNVKSIAEYLKKNGDIPDNLCFNDVDTVYIIADAKIDKESDKEKRACNNDYTLEPKDFESKILE